MIRYEQINRIVCEQLEQKCYGNKKQLAYNHLLGVSQLCLIFGQYENLDPELCAIMGLLHDFSQFIEHTSFDHASRSSFVANTMLSRLGGFELQEILVITTAIKNHSDKNKKQDRYSELLKMCDVVQSYIYEPERVLNSHQQYYVTLAKEKHYI